MNAEIQQTVDTRIIKTRYKNHELLARFWNGKYRGRIWKNKEKTADYEGDNIDLVLESLIQIIDQQRSNAFEQKNENTINQQDYIEAWLGIIPSLNPKILESLKLLSKSKNHTNTMTRLLRSSGCEIPNALLTQYQAVELALKDELLLEFFTSSPSIPSLLPALEMRKPSLTSQLTMSQIWAESLLSTIETH